MLEFYAIAFIITIGFLIYSIYLCNYAFCARRDFDKYRELVKTLGVGAVSSKEIRDRYQRDKRFQGWCDKADYIASLMMEVERTTGRRIEW